MCTVQFKNNCYGPLEYLYKTVFSLNSCTLMYISLVKRCKSNCDLIRYLYKVVFTLNSFLCTILFQI